MVGARRVFRLAMFCARTSPLTSPFAVSPLLTIGGVLLLAGLTGWLEGERGKRSSSVERSKFTEPSLELGRWISTRGESGLPPVTFSRTV